MRISLLITALGGIGLLGGILPRLGRLRRRISDGHGAAANDSMPATLRLRPSNEWVLERLCRSITTILWARPGLRRVCIDLTQIRTLDASSNAALRYAFRELQKAGVEVEVEGAGRRAARILTRESRSVAEIGASDGPSVDRGRTLH